MLSATGKAHTTYRKTLWDLAVDQDGLVATWQAHEVGVPGVEVAKLAHRGALVRVARGVYRFEDFPTAGREGYWRAVLWAGPGAVLSHSTALAVRDLSDVNPVDVEVTVPRARRMRRAEPVATVHHEDLDARDVDWWEGVPTVTAEKAIAQGIETGLPFHLLTQAIDTARARGSITREAGTRLRTTLDQSVGLSARRP